ncbi:MAG: hypothetical protein ACM3S0_16935 [Acidobacteriota bacterium]
MASVKEPFLKRALYFLRTVILIDLLLFAAVAFISVIVGWHTLAQYGQGVVWGSLLAFLVGASSVVTSQGLSRSPSYQYAQSVGLDKMSENVRQAMKEGRESNSFLLLMASVGAVAFVVGVLLASLG